MNTHKLRISVMAVSVGLALSACGGGGGGTAATGSTTTVGTVTGFGSVYVNGIEFETDNTRCEMDDVPVSGATNCGLQLGMKVRVEGSIDDSGRHGTAHAIHYDDDIEGPIANVQTDAANPAIRTFTIFGLPVQVEEGKTTFTHENVGAPAYGFADLADGHILEISGYFDGNRIVATHVERQVDSDRSWEMKGAVSGYTPGASQFSLDLLLSGVMVTVDIGGIALPAGFDNGVYVEVKVSAWDSASKVATASKIELEDRHDFDDDEDDAKLRGVLWQDDAGNYFIDTVPLQFEDDMEMEDHGNIADYIGMEVEVEGVMRDGVFVVEEIEQEDGDREIRGTVTGVTGSGKTGTLNIGDFSATTSNQTMMHQEHMDLSIPDLLNQEVEVEYYVDGSGQNIATHIECKTCRPGS